MGLVSKLINLLGGGPFRLHLDREQQSFRLYAWRGKTPIPISDLVRRHASLAPLVRLEGSGHDQCEVPLSRLTHIKLALQSTTAEHLRVSISSDVAVLQPVSPPRDFMLSYHWLENEGSLCPAFSNDAEYVGDGWFLSSAKYWRVDAITQIDDQWLRKKDISGADLKNFVREVVPIWRQRNFPCSCDLSYSDMGAFKADWIRIDSLAATLRISWQTDPRLIREVRNLQGYVISQNVLRPGVMPEVLTRDVDRGDITLSGEQIPNFITSVLPKIEAWCTPNPALRQQHLIIAGKSELILSVIRDDVSGIGSVSATPYFVVGDFKIPAEPLSQAISRDTQFVRLRNGWLPAEMPRQCGIGFAGRTLDGKSLGAFKLEPVEILRRKSVRLQGPWARIEFPRVELPKGTQSELPRKHLEFLREWGLPGGIVGPLEQCSTTLFEFLQQFSAANRDCRTLVVGSKKVLDSLPQNVATEAVRYDGLRKDPEFNASIKGLVLVSPKAFEEIPGLADLQWTITCILEADALIKSGSSKLFLALSHLRTTLRIGVFQSKDFLQKTAQREALSQVFGVPPFTDGDLVWKHTLREVADNHAIPTGFNVPRIAPAIKLPPAAEFTVGTPNDLSGIPISQRGSSTTAKIHVEISYSSGHGNFLQDAQQWVQRKERKAAFVPFMCYWPTYRSMNAQQLSWFFFWRDCVRNGTFPDTDLSYIFVHVYELINKIGISDDEDGYSKLTRVWREYRGRFPKLDNYLPDWIMDYAILNHCAADPLQPYLAQLNFGSCPSEPDLALTRYIDDVPNLPIILLERCSDYSLKRSKFCQAGHAPIVEKEFLELLEYLDQQFRSRKGDGLFASFRPPQSHTVARYPFRSAVYAGEATQIVLGDVYPYSQHESFRQFLASVAKYCENKLRKREGFGSSLRGIELSEEVRAIIDSYFDPDRAAVEAFSSTITIDPDRLRKLQAESDMVRNMLLAGQELPTASVVREPSPRPTDIIVHIPRPEGTPDHLLTDLDPVFALLCRLDKQEKHLLDILRRQDWRLSDSALASACPGVMVSLAMDRINGLASHYLGDILICPELGLQVVQEDYRDEIEYLMLHHMETGMGKTSDEEQPEQEWIELRERLAPFQRAALHVILEQNEVEALLSRIAHENATMPELLVETINELAIDCIGDMIIESGSSPPVIEQEDLEQVRGLLVSIN